MDKAGRRFARELLASYKTETQRDFFSYDGGTGANALTRRARLNRTVGNWRRPFS
jgi:hypothetical protein